MGRTAARVTAFIMPDPTDKNRQKPRAGHHIGPGFLVVARRLSLGTVPSAQQSSVRATIQS